MTDTFALKYRPKTIDQFYGQKAAIANVRGMLKAKSPPKAILITGPTGCGKTSLGKVIAAAVNGLTEIEGNDDLSEWNMGDNRTLDDVRSIAKQIQYLPRRKYRVFLLDEAHQIPTMSASALLKPLEEAPPHLVWILATDQPDKMLPTIRNRCVQIKLDHVQPDDIVQLLEYVCKEESLAFGEDHESFLKQVAMISGGVPRQALSVLQSASNIFASGETDHKEALKLAIDQSEVFQAEKIAVKMLLTIYAKKPDKTLALFKDVKDFQFLLMMLLSLNQYLIQEIVNAQPFQTYYGIELIKVFNKIMGRLPTLDRVVKTHQILTEIQIKSRSSNVDNYHVMVGLAAI